MSPSCSCCSSGCSSPARAGGLRALLGRAGMSALAQAMKVERWTPASRAAVAGVAHRHRLPCLRAAVPRRRHGRPADRAVHLRDPGGDVERAGRLRRAGLGRPAGVLRARRLFHHPPCRRRHRSVRRRCFVAAVVVGVFSLPLSLFMLRLRGGEFAIGMWVIAELVASAGQSRPADPGRDRHVADLAQRLRRRRPAARPSTGWRWRR